MIAPRSAGVFIRRLIEYLSNAMSDDHKPKKKLKITQGSPPPKGKTIIPSIFEGTETLDATLPEERKQEADRFRRVAGNPLEAVRKKVKERLLSVGFEGLGKEEREFVYVQAMCDRVNAGGFHYYLRTNSADHAPQTLDALRAVSSVAVKKIFKQVLASVGEPYPEKKKERLKRLSDLCAGTKRPTEFEDRISELTDAFYSCDEAVVDWALLVVAKHYEQTGL